MNKQLLENILINDDENIDNLIKLSFEELLFIFNLESKKFDSIYIKLIQNKYDDYIYLSDLLFFVIKNIYNKVIFNNNNLNLNLLKCIEYYDKLDNEKKLKLINFIFISKFGIYSFNEEIDDLKKIISYKLFEMVNYYIKYSKLNSDILYNIINIIRNAEIKKFELNNKENLIHLLKEYYINNILNDDTFNSILYNTIFEFFELDEKPFIKDKVNNINIKLSNISNIEELSKFLSVNYDSYENLDNNLLNEKLKLFDELSFSEILNWILTKNEGYFLPNQKNKSDYDDSDYISSYYYIEYYLYYKILVDKISNIEEAILLYDKVNYFIHFTDIDIMELLMEKIKLYKEENKNESYKIIEINLLNKVRYNNLDVKEYYKFKIDNLEFLYGS